MRSVFVFPHLAPDAAEATLDEVGERQELSPDLGTEWVVDGCLYVRIEPDGAGLWADWSDAEVDRLDHQLGLLPTWGVVIDVSGDVDGRREVTRLLRPLLASGGVALDDYSEHAWTLAEIDGHEAGTSRAFLRPS